MSVRGSSVYPTTGSSHNKVPMDKNTARWSRNKADEKSGPYARVTRYGRDLRSEVILRFVPITCSETERGGASCVSPNIASVKDHSNGRIFTSSQYALINVRLRTRTDLVRNLTCYVERARLTYWLHATLNWQLERHTPVESILCETRVYRWNRFDFSASRWNRTPSVCCIGLMGKVLVRPSSSFDSQ